MKKKKNSYFKYLSLLFTMIVLILVAGCGGPTPTTPIINSFLANPTSITVGESSTLSWSVTDATTVTIDQSVGSVASTGTTAVSPVINTTYTLTAPMLQEVLLLRLQLLWERLSVLSISILTLMAQKSILME